MSHSNDSWPADGIENIDECPVCGSKEKDKIYDGLTDRIFFCAPGKWSLYQCKNCKSAYIDPRPTTEAIGLAYSNYITHETIPNYGDLGFSIKLRTILANGYRNFRYGTRDYPSSVIGILAATINYNGRAVIDAGMRHLPKKQTTGRLLDVGFGNGVFLKRAQQAGWRVAGVDSDPVAVDAVRRSGIDVRLGGVESIDPSKEKFDIITMSHVIEHVHYPDKVLKACCDLLKSDGVLWIETPNIESVGHEIFGESWRGLEPPRHLVMFNYKSIKNLLRSVGFGKIECQPYRPLCDTVFRASLAISESVDPYSNTKNYKISKIIRKAEKIAIRQTGLREFITLKAWKSPSV